MRQVITPLFCLLIAPACLATNPASTAYVDQQIALTKAYLISQIGGNTPAHPIGSCYGGGVVYYLNPDANAPAGQRGLIAALSDASVGFSAFAKNVVVPPGITQRLLFTGASNTAALLLLGPGAQAATTASTYTDGVYNDWFLPSQNELDELSIRFSNNASLFTACAGTDPDTITNYWTSSQEGVGQNAFYVNFANGEVTSLAMASNLLVRSIRSF